jgi:hypothetical protein
VRDFQGNLEVSNKKSIGLVSCVLIILPIFVSLWTPVWIPFTRGSSLHEWNLPFVFYGVEAGNGREGIVIDAKTQLEWWTD